ncbi:tumor necrosis factor ligand superfamily member 14-like [Micropterus salmoides]|uniref:tumor necrosis factor ligand superfamily member 14-like n=1 Tax=Micropterus salmoides TaxID=27706 RepID=UPI0018EDDBAE|nr:tumor necrosis factor ligand superfamily member 14-like [Micropterus salmoides]
MQSGEMAEGGEGTCPKVFVVDSQANYISMPSRRESKWARAGQKYLFLLVGLAMLGLVVEGCLIYNLYKKTQAFPLSGSHLLCQNSSNPKTSDGTIMSQVGHKESNEIPTVRTHQEQIQQRPFAQLLGSSHPMDEQNVVQWVHEGGETITRNMDYNNGRLLVQKDGYYYLYSKVTLEISNTAMECSVFQHKVMKKTEAYGNPIELMRSKRVSCGTQRPSSSKPSSVENLWNSFLAGIFHLQKGDKIFVRLDNIKKMHEGSTDNLMGAFMIFP